MKKSVKAFTALLLALCLIFTAAGCASNKSDDSEPNTPANESGVKLEKIFDYVFDAGTYTELDDEKAYAYFDSIYDLRPGGCTAVAKTTDTEGTMVGRNMDIYISNNPSYFFRTDRADHYKTMGLMYANTNAPSYDDVMENGLDSDFYNLIPFTATDVMNEYGLYVEVNMRTGEYDENGGLVFGCDGTRSSKGLESERRLCSFMLPLFLGERCKTVAEAVDYAQNKLDLYTPAADTAFPWNFCFVVADATGEYGVIEIAKNEVIYTQGGTAGVSDTGKTEMKEGSAQANFYIAPEFAKDEQLKIGLGRYDVVKNGWADVETERQMFDMMDSISYFQSYFPWCRFDNRSEEVSIVVTDPELLKELGMPEEYLNKVWDNDFVNEHPDYVNAYIAHDRADIMEHIKNGTLRDANYYWESAFTLVANCSQQTILVRFNECNKNMIKFTFE